MKTNYMSLNLNNQQRIKTNLKKKQKQKHSCFVTVSMFHYSPASATLLQLRPPYELMQQRTSLHYRHGGADERPRKGRMTNILPLLDT